MLKHKIRLISLISILVLGVSASITFGFASWQFNKSAAPTEVTNVAITNNWHFGGIEPGSVIEVDEDGNIKINGKTVEDAEISYSSGQDLKGGDVTMKIGVDENGELVVNEYAATNIASNLFTSSGTVNLPESVVYNGENYPIISLSEPITLDVGGWIIGKNITFNVPEGYKNICDNAFNNISVATSTTIKFSLPSTLEYLGNQTFKLNISNVTTQIKFAGTKEQFKTLVNNSASQYEGEGNYSFFTGASGNVSVTCSDGTVRYRSNGSYLDG